MQATRWLKTVSARNVYYPCRRSAGFAILGALLIVTAIISRLSNQPYECPSTRDLSGFAIGDCPFGGGRVNYGLYVPPHLSSLAGGHALIVALVEDRAKPNHLFRNELASAVRAKRLAEESFDFIILFWSDAGAGADWTDRFAAITHVLELVIERHNIDSRRVYLFGCPDASGFWDLAVFNHKRWAAVVGVQPVGVPFAPRFPHIPIWLFVDRRLANKSIAPVKTYLNAINSAGVETRYTEYSKGVEVYGREELYDWLAEKSRP